MMKIKAVTTYRKLMLSSTDNGRNVITNLQQKVSVVDFREESLVRIKLPSSNSIQVT